MKKLIPILFLVIFIAACSPAIETNPIAPPSPTLTSIPPTVTPIPPTATPTATSTVTPTSTPLPHQVEIIDDITCDQWLVLDEMLSERKKNSDNLPPKKAQARTFLAYADFMYRMGLTEEGDILACSVTAIQEDEYKSCVTKAVKILDNIEENVRLCVDYS